MKLSEVATPALVLNLKRLDQNATRLAVKLESHGVRLRPHLKTVKCVEVAHRALNGGFMGIAVATLNEASYFLENGFTDIQYPVCISPGKLSEAADLIQKGAKLSILIDSLYTAREVCVFAKARQTIFRVFIEVDCGEHRTGMPVSSSELVTTAKLLFDSDFVDFRGVLTHAGHSYACQNQAEIELIASQEQTTAVEAASLIRQAGIECPEVSIGSTPTAMFGKTFDGITEVRAGVYLFGDLYQTCLNTCSTDEIAISVLATVISVNHTRKTIVVDAGGLALSKDRGWRRGQNFGFGLVADERGKLFEARTIVQSVHQEHGEIEIKDESLLKTLSVGCRVRIYPNHACMTAAMYDQYIVVQGTNQSIVAIWGKARGW